VLSDEPKEAFAKRQHERFKAHMRFINRSGGGGGSSGTTTGGGNGGGGGVIKSPSSSTGSPNSTGGGGGGGGGPEKRFRFHKGTTSLPGINEDEEL